LQPDFSNAISADGSRVFWTALEYIPRFFGPEDAGSKALYMREDGTRTVQLDAPELGASGVGGGGRFWTATPDGSKVFFTDESRLTEDSTAEPGKPDLYECELPQAGGSCTLSDLTANQGEAANVKGVIGTSENGEYVYFVAEGVLAGNENANHEKAEPQACVDSGGEKQGIESRSQCNLYVWHRGAVPRFIARLSGEDNEQTVSQYDSGGTAYGDWQSDLGLRTAQVAPDGSTLAFMSQRSLTGYPSEGWDQVYVYDFDSGGLSCASCNPTGTPAAASASLPISFNDTHALRDVSEDGGRVFFLSSEQVVPQASSGQPDVYEWERNGEGSCATAGGCVYLLSGATSPEQSYFLDASANGNDVFIITRAQLLPQDQNELWDVYDARVDAPVPVAPPTCTGTGCQGIPGAPPIFATPSSVTFNGVGNFPPGGRASSPVVVKPKTKTVKCAKGKKLSHGKCIKRKKSKKTKKASNYGRAK
jgi:Tol biopolymer transport system component